MLRSKDQNTPLTPASGTACAQPVCRAPHDHGRGRTANTRSARVLSAVLSAGLAGSLMASGALLPGSASAQDLWAAPGGDQSTAQASPAAAAPAATRPTTTQPTTAQPTTTQPADDAGAAPVLRDPHNGYFVTLTQGRNAIVRRDADAAISELRNAAGKTPNRPEAYCHTGDAYQQRGVREGREQDLKEALEAYRTCARFARGGDNGNFVAMAVIGEAQTLELMDGRSTEARRAWAMALNGGQDAGARGLAQARITALDNAEQLNRRYDIVRNRIAERKRIAAEEASKPAKKKKRRR